MRLLAPLAGRARRAGRHVRAAAALDDPARTHRGAPVAAAINDIVQRAAARAELPHAADYTAHNLRTGGATSAYRAWAPVSSIARHGRWAPNSPVVLGYIRSVDRWRDNPMRAVGL